MAYDTAGNLWVADTGNDRVVELDPSAGTVLYTSPAGAFSAPRDVAAGPAGSVYVADTGHGRIAQILPGGAIDDVRTGLSNPAAVAWSGATAVYAADDTHVTDVAGGTQVAPPPGESSWDHPDENS